MDKTGEGRVPVKLDITITTHGSAFDGDVNTELVRVLRDLADHILVYGAHTGLVCRDRNGIECGMVKVKLL